jgi:hypothetical protein
LGIFIPQLWADAIEAQAARIAASWRWSSVITTTSFGPLAAAAGPSS